MCNQIRVDIYTTRHLGHRGCISGSGENDIGNFFASYFLHKDKILLTHRRSSKYNYGQESRIGTPKYSDVSKGKIPKFSAGKRGTNLGRAREGGKYPTPTTSWRSGKKVVIGRKVGMTLTTPHSRVKFETLKVPASA